MTTLTVNINNKGQITIPKIYRDQLSIKPNTKLFVSLNIKNNSVEIVKEASFFEVIKQIKPIKKTDPVTARKFMHTNYAR